MRRPLLGTARIDLEPMRATHLPLLVDLDADPVVLRYILIVRAVSVSWRWASPVLACRLSRPTPVQRWFVGRRSCLTQIRG